MSIEEKKLSEEELENVNGGCAEEKSFTGLKGAYKDYNIPVDKYSGVIGKRYLFDDASHKRWIFGRLVNSYEENEGLFTRRTHDIFVEDAYGFSENKKCYLSVSEYGTYEVSGNIFQMYAKAGE